MKTANCFLVTCFSEDQPGFLDFSYRMHALAANYDLTVISQDPLLQPELSIPSANYLALGRRAGKYGWLRYLWECAAYIRRHKPDLLVLMHSSAAPITLLSRTVPSCLYWNEHPTNLIQLPERFSPFKYWLAIACHRLIFLGAKHASLVMPIGEEHRDDLLAQGCDQRRMQMIYMGVADHFLNSASAGDERNNGQLRLVYVGSVSKPRGRDVMLEAMAEVIRAGVDVHLTIVGADSSQLTYCRNEISKLGIAHAVTVLGRFPGNEMPRILAEADWGMCLWEDKPWWRFNPPTKLFEYLVAGLPVLASNIRTHTRYLEHGRNGFIFDYGPKPLAEAIRQIALQKENLPVLKRNALASGRQYLWSRIEPDFLSAVRQVAMA